MTRSEMIARLVFAMGGRAAEELVFREPTTGAVSDIEQATKIARAMVTEYGMSSKLGAVRYGTEHGDPFLGRSMGTQPDYSHEVAQIIDDEVRKLIEAAHTEAWEVLTEYRDVLDTLAGELLEKETLHRVELEAIFGDVKKRPRLTIFDDFGGRVPSDKPPIKTPGELAIERGEPWPPPVPEPAFKLAIAEASKAAQVEAQKNGTNGSANGSPVNGTANVPGNGSTPNGPTQPDYGAPAGWHAPGWPPSQPGQYPPPPQQQGHYGQYPPPGPGYPPPYGWAPPPPPPPQPGHYPPYQQHPQPGAPVPQGGAPAPSPHDDEQGRDDRSNTPPPG
jgi:cell division protease FtsH